MDHTDYVHRSDGVRGSETPLVGNNPHSRNEHYHLKAINAIRAAGEKLGIKDIADTEGEMKQLLSIIFRLDDDQAELAYEIMERVASCHWKKINHV